MLDNNTFITEYDITDNVRVELRSSRLVWYFSFGVELFRMDARYSDMADVAIISPEVGERNRPRIMLTIRVRRPARVMRKARTSSLTESASQQQQMGQDTHRWDITLNERFIRCSGDFSGTGQFGNSLVYRFALDPVGHFTNMRGDMFENRVLGHFMTRYLHSMGLLRTHQQGVQSGDGARVLIGFCVVRQHYNLSVSITHMHSVFLSPTTLHSPTPSSPSPTHTAKLCGKPHSLQPLKVLSPKDAPTWIPTAELKGLRFLVSYWLEVCISHGVFSRYQVTPAVQGMLQSKVVPEAEAVAVWGWVCVRGWGCGVWCWVCCTKVWCC